MKTEIEILQEIAAVGKNMRENQKAYFINRTANFLRKSKQLEIHFDILIIELSKYRERLNSQQQQSFF